MHLNLVSSSEMEGYMYLPPPSGKDWKRTRRQQAYLASTLLCVGLAFTFIIEEGSNAGLSPNDSTKPRSFSSASSTVLDDLMGIKEQSDNTRRIHQRERQLQIIPTQCYQNMVTNGDFEDGLSEWSTVGTVDVFDVLPRDDGLGGNVGRFQDRYTSNHGIQQTLNPSLLNCLYDSTGEGFYFRVTADIKLLDSQTGEGSTGCRNDRQHYYMSNCPRLDMWTYKEGTGEATHFEIHDANLEWDPNGWNTFDVIFKVPDGMTGLDNAGCYIKWKGAQPTNAWYIDNMVVQRIEAADLPVGFHIWQPEPLDCSDNILQNGDGEYQSPYGWESFGHWAADFNITAVEDASASGPDDIGFALLALDRGGMTQHLGLGQWFSATSTPCFGGNNFYFRITADVQLYDQTTGQGITSCTPLDHRTLRNCPKLLITVRRQGQKTAFSSFYDEDIIGDNWNPSGWNRIDMTVAMHPIISDPVITNARIVILGGPANSVLKMDNARARRITYNEIPAGHPVYSLTQGEPIMDSPVKTCKSTGDPHFTTFNGILFDHHALGWNLLYEKADLKVETYHLALPNGSTIAINHAVKVTYKGNVYDFVDGTKPPGDEYFDETGDEIILPTDPVAKVTVTSRYFFRGEYIHNVFVTTADTAPPATGLCVDETEETQAAVAADAITVVEFDPNGVTQEQAELECANIDDPETFEECVFDLRIATAAVAAEGESSPIEVARSFVVAAEDTNTIERTLEAVADEEAREEIAIESGFVADPLIVGLNRQVFKFDGRSDAWYANLATSKVQWNMRFKEFEKCPLKENMFVTGVGMSFDFSSTTNMIHHGIQDEEESKIPERNTLEILINEDDFLPGCPGKELCLAEGSISLIADGKPITAPGEYFVGHNGAIRIVAYNTFVSCSRRWYDFVEPLDDQLKLYRSLDANSKSPIEMLYDSASKLVDSEDCFAWADERTTNEDFFLQQGGWATIFVETPHVSFHIEYRQSDGQEDDNGCPYHSLDAWMSKVSPEMKAEEWAGILGETRRPIFTETGEQHVSDRQGILAGKRDEDYEVGGPHALDFAARNMVQGTWKDGMKDAIRTAFAPTSGSMARRTDAGSLAEEYYSGEEGVGYSSRLST